MVGAVRFELATPCAQGRCEIANSAQKLLETGRSEVTTTDNMDVNMDERQPPTEY